MVNYSVHSPLGLCIFLSHQLFLLSDIDRNAQHLLFQFTGLEVLTCTKDKVVQRLKRKTSLYPMQSGL